MLHTLPSCPCTRNNCYILKNIKKSWKCQQLFAVISQKWAMGENFHFSSNFGLETHPAVLREYAFYPPPPVQPGSHPPFFLIPLLCIVLCIMYFTCKDAPIMYARHSLYADQVSLGSSWASQANALKQTIICQNERKIIHYQYHCHICCYFCFASNMMEQILMLVFLLTMQWSSLSGKCWQNAVALWILIEIYALWILIVIFLSLCNWE